MSWLRRSSADDPTVVPTPAATPDVEPLREDEVAWVRSTIAGLDEQDVRPGDIDDLGRHYDELLTGWLRLAEAGRPDPRPVIDQIGLAFGQYVADHSGLEWRVANAEQGPEIVLYRAEDGVLVYPTTLVSQRWEAHDTRVLPALARAVIGSVASRG